MLKLRNPVEDPRIQVDDRVRSQRTLFVHEEAGWAAMEKITEQDGLPRSVVDLQMTRARSLQGGEPVHRPVPRERKQSAGEVFAPILGEYLPMSGFLTFVLLGTNGTNRGDKVNMIAQR